MFNSTFNNMDKVLSELIFSAVQIEGIQASKGQTDSIIKGNIESGVSFTDALKIKNIKYAWEFLSHNYELPLTWELYQQYNLIIRPEADNAGCLRDDVIGIGGTDYIPPTLNTNPFDNIIGTALDSFHTLGEQGSAMFLLLAKHQLFFDGNKRSAQMLVNHWFAQVDAQMALLVKENERDYFLDDVIRFYEGQDLDSAALDFDERYIYRF